MNWRRTSFIASLVGIITWLGFRRRGGDTKSKTAHRRTVVKNILQDMNDSNTSVLAAGIGYNAALAFFPSFAAALAIASIVIQPEQVASVIQQVNAYLPKDIAGLVSVQLEAQAGQHSGNYIVALVAIAISLIGASAAVVNTLRSLNVVYGVRETRNIIRLRAMGTIILICTLLLAAVVAALLVVDDYMIEWGVPEWIVSIGGMLRWPVLMVLVGGAFATLYRYGPNRQRIQWSRVGWGAAVGTLLWLLVTAGLYLYTRYFSTFSESYTLFAGIVVLMIWFNLSAVALLVGAHVNARLEARAKLPAFHRS